MYNSIKAFIKNSLQQKKNRIFKQKPKNDQSITVMESNTLGITVIQQTNFQKCDTLELTNEQWEVILEKGKLDGIPYNRIYFSFLKGIPDKLRMRIWLMLCTNNSSKDFVFSAQTQKILTSQIQLFMDENQQQQECESKQNKPNQKAIQQSTQPVTSIFTVKLFRKLSESKPKQKQTQQIEKDVLRTFPYKQKYLFAAPLLRKILYALSNSGVQYAQGMNYILLFIMIFCFESLGINKKTISQMTLQNERNIFIIMREIVLRLNEVFDNENILKIIKNLQQKISESVPDIFFNIHKYGMDTYGLFSPHYYSLLTYSDPPLGLAKRMMDLFFLQSHQAITSLIVRMLEISHDQIMKIKDAEKLQLFIRNQIFHFCFETLCQQQLNAKSISDFGLSFYQNVELA